MASKVLSVGKFVVGKLEAKSKDIAAMVEMVVRASPYESLSNVAAREYLMRDWLQKFKIEEMAVAMGLTARVLQSEMKVVDRSSPECIYVDGVKVAKNVSPKISHEGSVVKMKAYSDSRRIEDCVISISIVVAYARDSVPDNAEIAEILWLGLDEAERLIKAG